MNYLGVDPDLHTPAFAAVDDAGRVIWAYIVKCKGSTGQGAVVAVSKAINDYFHSRREPFGGIAVEGQQIYMGACKNPGSILLLAATAGALISTVQRCSPEAPVWFPKPSEWKGSRPKQIHHKQIMRRLGWEYGTVGPLKGKDSYAYPLDPPFRHDLKKSDWKHVMDAIGLALYAREAASGR